MANYEKIHFSLHDQLQIYVLIMTISCEKKGAAQLMMKRKNTKEFAFFSPPTSSGFFLSFLNFFI